MHILIIQHESFESPGAILEWIERRGHSFRTIHLFDGEACPRSVEADMLIVMGGPQSPATTKEECPHFDAEAEMSLIRSYVQHGRAVLGVCLGAQLIGEALGAKFDHSPEREIGVFPLVLTEAGKSDSFFARCKNTLMVGHWHGDMPGLTAESEVLAFSEGCPRQIVRYRPNVYGFQCHFEFTRNAIEGMIESCHSELGQYKGLRFIETAEGLRAHDYGEMNRVLFDFLDYLVCV